MSERSEAVRTVRVHYDCDALNCAGEMIPTGSARMMSPPRFEHACNVCGARKDLRHTYPRIDYVAEGATGIVDWSEDAPGRNMYGCLPCPKCGSKYRASYTNSKMSKKLGHPTVECDECGFVERASVVESKD